MTLEQEINATDRGVAEPKRFWEEAIIHIQLCILPLESTFSPTEVYATIFLVSFATGDNHCLIIYLWSTSFS